MVNITLRGCLCQRFEKSLLKKQNTNTKLVTYCLIVTPIYRATSTVHIGSTITKGCRYSRVGHAYRTRDEVSLHVFLAFKI